MFRKGFALDYIREPDRESVGDDAHGVPQTGACEAQNKVEVRRKSRQICSILIGNNVTFYCTAAGRRGAKEQGASGGG